ncbi:hypothetical protein [Bdellovibrio sp. HCB-110]|uniref:hypothetical protein n=1 Tax=Bdellovibrio sp. HCB-110 TaxID=3391182 RepID=UPI0039B4B7F7
MSELEYLERLLSDEFIEELVATLAGAMGRQVSEFTVNVAHLDKSPKVEPHGESYSVELADVLFHLTLENPLEQTSLERAYLFQVKQSEHEDGVSTRRQKELFQWLKRIRIDEPLVIDPSRSWRDFANSTEIIKSGFWYMHTSRKSVAILKNLFGDAAPLLTHVDGANAFGPPFSLPEFLAKFVGGSAGRDITVSDDWSYFIKNILQYKRKYEKKTRFATGTSQNPHYSGFRWMGLHQVYGKVTSFISRWMDKLWALVHSRPFIVISIAIKSVEGQENIGGAMERNIARLEDELDKEIESRNSERL